MSDILLREVNSERADAILVEIGPRGLIEIPKSSNIIAHLVLSGRITIECDEMKRPTTLNEGEYGLFFYGSHHRIYVDARRPSAKPVEISKWPKGDVPIEIKVGRNAGKARFLSAALQLIYRINRPHLENPTPPMYRLKHGTDDVFRDGALLNDIEPIEAACRGSGANAFINTLMNMHLTHAMRCAGMNLDSAFKELSNSPYLMSNDRDRAVATALRLLNTHPERVWTVASLAHDVALSRSTLAATFRSHVGMGPMEYLTKVRMEKAAELLAEHRLDLPLFNIAQRIGYSAASSFARSFKAHYGLSPRAFARRKKNT